MELEDEDRLDTQRVQRQTEILEILREGQPLCQQVVTKTNEMR